MFFSESSKIIGERINPTGKKKFKQALKEHDLEYILREGIAQQDNGAHILDVNVGLPDIDGNEIISSVRQWTSCPIIVVSARSSERDKVTALDLGQMTTSQSPLAHRSSWPDPRFPAPQ